jgi:hypothetical protein
MVEPLETAPHSGDGVVVVAVYDSFNKVLTLFCG